MINEEFKTSAINFGFDEKWIVEILEKYGSEVVAIIVEAARNGFSIALIQEIINKLGPLFLELIVDFTNKKNMTGEIIPGPVVEGKDAFIDLIVEKYLPTIIQNYLPMLFEKYGSQIITYFINMLMDKLKK